MINKTTSDSFLNSDVENDNVDFGKIFRFLLMQSKLIISIVLAGFIISITIYSFSTKQYEVKSLLQYEAFNQDIFDPSKALQMSSSNSSSDITNMIELYESRTNYIKVITDLKLNLKINGLDDDEYVDVEIASDESNPLQSRELKFSFSENEFSLLNEDLNVIETSEFGEEIYFENLNISIKSVKLNKYRPIEIRFTDPKNMFKGFKARMNINALTSRNVFLRNEGLINVSYITDDIDLGKKIINYANDIFLNQRIYDQSEKSRRAISFIDNNIKSIEESVESNKLKLKQFREKNKSIDVGLEIEAIINKIQSLDEALGDIDIEIAKAEEIYTSNNPAYLNLINKKTLLELQKDNVLSEIEMMPKEQQEYIDLFNNLEVSQTLFEELESRRLGFSILQASTIGDIRVIDKAYVNTLVSPQIVFVFLATILSLLFALLIAVFRGFYSLPISNPAEIFDNRIYLPIIGVVPEIDNFEDEDDNLRLNSALEALIVNINSIQNNKLDNNLITITSPSPGNGKSTISMKLAEGLAKIGKKVLLVDNDLKRGHIARDYNIKSISENTFNSIDASTIDKYMIKDSFYVIPRVKGLANSFQFLYSNQYKEKIKFFKDNFDFIIFDTGPLLSVADSSILIEKSDFNLLIVRHGINRINEIKQSVDNFSQINKNIDGIIYNAYAKPKSYYGYYGLYGNYSYQYYAEKYLEDTYEYEKKD